MKSTLIELIMVMTLLVLFGMTIFSLMYTGSDTQKRIEAKKNAQMDARIASSYINVKMRQNDSAGKIELTTFFMEDRNDEIFAIIIHEADFFSDVYYDTWIYVVDGKLYECITDTGVSPTRVEDGFFIVNAKSITSILHDDGSITNTIVYMYGDENQMKEQKISTTVYLRSYAGVH